MKKNTSNILITAFIIRFALLLVNTFVVTLPQGGGDALTFENHAYLFSISNYDLDYFDIISRGAKLFELICSFIYYIIGRQPFILGLFIVVLGVYTVKLTHKATLLLWNNSLIAKKAAWFTALFPVLMLHSAIILREIPINVLLLLAVISFIKYWKFHKQTQFILFIFYTILATLLHSGSIFLLVGFLFFIVFGSKGKNIFTKITIVVFATFSFILLNSSGLLNKLGGSVDKSIELLEIRENYTTEGNSAYPDWIMMTGGINDIWKVPVRFITFIFAPLIPFWAHTIWHSIGLIDAFLYLFMFYTIYKKRKLFKLNNTAKGVFIMSLFLILVFSMGVANVGTAIRHRAKMAPLLIIVFTGLYYYKIPKVKKT